MLAYLPTAVVVSPLASRNPKAWRNELCDCCAPPGGCGNCCCSFFCMSCKYGSIAGTLEAQDVCCGGNGCGSCCLYCVLDALVIIPLSCVLRMQARDAIRSKYHLEEDGCSTCCIVLFCGPCALAQEYNEVVSRRQVMTVVSVPPAGRVMSMVGTPMAGPNAVEGSFMPPPPAPVRPCPTPSSPPPYISQGVPPYPQPYTPSPQAMAPVSPMMTHGALQPPILPYGSPAPVEAARPSSASVYKGCPSPQPSAPSLYPTVPSLGSPEYPRI